jgi:hypothetical protein
MLFGITRQMIKRIGISLNAEEITVSKYKEMLLTAQ